MAAVVAVAVIVAFATTSCGGSDDDSGEKSDQATFTLKLDEPSRENSDKVADVVDQRMKALDLTATVTSSDSTVTVRLPAADAEMAEVALRPPSTIEFRPMLEFPTDPTADTTPEEDVTASAQVIHDVTWDRGMRALLGPAAVNGSDLESVTAESASGGSSINLVFTEAGIGRLNELARRCFESDPTCPVLSDTGGQHGQVAIVIDGTIVSTPTVIEPGFERDRIQISTGDSTDVAEAQAETLNSIAGVPTWTLS